MSRPPKADKKPGVQCHVCQRQFSPARVRPWIWVRPGVSDLITASAPGWGDGTSIYREDLTTFRAQYVEKLLENERGELGALDRQVIESLERGGVVSRNLVEAVEEKATFGERTADKVATFGGSWTFIITFAVILAVWTGANG